MAVIPEAALRDVHGWTSAAAVRMTESASVGLSTYYQVRLRALGRAPCTHARLHRRRPRMAKCAEVRMTGSDLATNPGDKCG